MTIHLSSFVVGFLTCIGIEAVAVIAAAAFTANKR